VTIRKLFQARVPVVVLLLVLAFGPVARRRNTDKALHKQLETLKAYLREGQP
jgi:hypothetical protein